eukprot:NODE_8_length_66115_cov_0.981823.p57 type:complete len:113 gc:universal NODE_8_length_66115_cov_0.981823:20286-19948(-)
MPLINSTTLLSNPNFPTDSTILCHFRLTTYPCSFSSSIHARTVCPHLNIFKFEIKYSEMFRLKAIPLTNRESCQESKCKELLSIFWIQKGKMYPISKGLCSNIKGFTINGGP